ncbi:MAG: PHP domain-containing protein [Christensenellales bacterium]|jgi:predicted metal-dependent phosphoesterase TrpH
MTGGKFTVQLHMHTSETSACGVDDAVSMVRACKAAGYDMIAITDHFLNANIGCPRDLPYRERVEYLFRGYRAAKKEGDKIGLIVLKAWETFTDGPEYLTYGLDEEFLLAHPDIDTADKDTYLSLVRKAGGFVIHAHPFREAYYIPKFDPDPHAVEAIEVFNAEHMDPSFDKKALAFAKKHRLIQTAGADAHRAEEVRSGAMRFSHPLRDTRDLVEALRAGDGEIVRSL